MCLNYTRNEFISLLNIIFPSFPINEPKNPMDGDHFEGDIAGVRIISSNVIHQYLDT
jgi:hypothetical protein